MNRSGLTLLEVIICGALIGGALVAFMQAIQTRVNAYQNQKILETRRRLALNLAKQIGMGAAIQQSVTFDPAPNSPLNNCVGIPNAQNNQNANSCMANPSAPQDFPINCASYDNLTATICGTITGTSTAPLYYDATGSSCAGTGCSSEQYPLAVYTQVFTTCYPPLSYATGQTPLSVADDFFQPGSCAIPTFGPWPTFHIILTIHSRSGPVEPDLVIHIPVGGALIGIGYY